MATNHKVGGSTPSIPNIHVIDAPFKISEKLIQTVFENRPLAGFDLIVIF